MSMSIHVDFVVQFYQGISETQLVHIRFDLGTVKIFGAIAIARFQFRSFGLSSKNADAIHASSRAFFTPKHGLAKSVIIFQSGGAKWISGANPLSGRTRNYGVLSSGVHDFFLTRLNVAFTLLAKRISSTITLKMRKKMIIIIIKKIRSSTWCVIWQKKVIIIKLSQLLYE